MLTEFQEIEQQLPLSLSVAITHDENEKRKNTIR